MTRTSISKQSRIQALVILLLLIVHVVIHAQDNDVDFLGNDSRLRAKSSKIVSNEWFFIDENEEISEEEFYTDFLQELGLRSKNELTTLKEWTDELGVKHIKHRQIIDGFEVEGADLTLPMRYCRSKKPGRQWELGQLTLM